MAGRFPGAADLEQYWRNLRDGVESITFFTDGELQSAGVPPSLLSDPRYVKARGVLEGGDLFDPAFFGLSPREAEIMDPQQRLLLVCAWEALENAGYDADRYPGLIGLYAGVGQNSYFLNNLYPNRELMQSVGDFEAMLGNDKDFAATRVSYKMNLKGPSVAVQCACSTSLVAVAQACQSLLSGESDIALAGACTLASPQTRGYLYQEGGIQSPDGHCRAFDAKAKGTVFSNGAGMVVLKRLDEALADGDCIHAVIKAAAVNNDGSLKAGYTAPSVDGQAKVIRAAHLMAGVAPDTVTYLEAHGTATALGDPIEFAALTQAFRQEGGKRGFCALGSVKANIGHTDTAAGVAGLIKTVLMLKHRMLPPSLHFETANPGIDLRNSPFYVNSRLSPWEARGHPLRAGVSSFGIGGTNAHIIVEEAPQRDPSGPSRPWNLVLLSARTQAALDAATKNLVRHLQEHPELALADVAYTLRNERKVFEHRRMALCSDTGDCVRVLEGMDPERVQSSARAPGSREVAFLFSGQGSQYVDMGLDLYRTERVFQEHVDRCAEVLRPHLGLDLRGVLYPGGKDPKEAAALLTQTGITQPALFTIEYALAQLWMSWGVTPAALLGHSIGEYTAACLAGVFSLGDALALVAARGRLMQQLRPGAMLVVPLAEKQVRLHLNDRLALAVINGPSLCVVSGDGEAVEELKARLAKKNVHGRLLQTSHAFHSHMMEPILDLFTEEVRRAGPRPPRIPLLSNVTGTWMTDAQAMNPAYWARHLRQTVRFSDCLQELMKEPRRVLLEVGPGYTFSVLANQQPLRSRDHVVLSSMRHPKAAQQDSAFILQSLGQLWLAGVRMTWQSIADDERLHRVPLPTYPFEGKRCWIDPPRQAAPARPAEPEVPCAAVAAPCAELPLREQRKEQPATQDEIAQVILNIWRESLGHDRVTVHDNFFDLGGNSLIALRMISQTEKVFNTKLPLSMFKAPTVSQLVKFIAREEKALP
jgi:acyl transferase domain-containing protein